MADLIYILGIVSVQDSHFWLSVLSLKILKELMFILVNIYTARILNI